MSKSITLGFSVQFRNPMDGRSVGKVLQVRGAGRDALLLVEWPNGGKGWFLAVTIKAE